MHHEKTYKYARKKSNLQKVLSAELSGFSFSSMGVTALRKKTETFKKVGLQEQPTKINIRTIVRKGTEILVCKKHVALGFEQQAFVVSSSCATYLYVRCARWLIEFIFKPRR